MCKGPHNNPHWFWETTLVFYVHCVDCTGLNGTPLLPAHRSSMAHTHAVILFEIRSVSDCKDGLELLNGKFSILLLHVEYMYWMPKL